MKFHFNQMHYLLIILAVLKNIYTEIYWALKSLMCSSNAWNLLSICIFSCYFFIWLLLVCLNRDSGSVNVEKTVPDTITKWAAGAFCVSSVGFGVAPNVALVAFQPFFVSLTLPYSVIRGEVFTLKATVFNYLSKCIMVNILAVADVIDLNGYT